MPRSACALAALCLLVVASGCNRFGAQRWSQFHADGPNEGFIGVHSSPGLARRWEAQVGPVAYASPVLGPDGSIYIANLNGAVLSFTPAGAQRWSVTPVPGAVFLASPAVADDGSVYVVSTVNADPVPRSTLHRLDAAGNVLWSFPLPEAYTSAAPKLWPRAGGVDVFLYVHNAYGGQLYVVNQDGQLLARATVCGAVIQGGYSIDLTQLLTFLFTGVPVFEFNVQGLNLIDSLGWPDPTVAVVEASNVAPRGGVLLVVANNDCSIAAYDWTPPTLRKRWEHTHDGVPHSSAAVSGGIVAVGRKDGKLAAWLAGTGAPQWAYDVGEPVQASPSIMGIQVYAASRQKLSVVDFNGSLLQQRPLPANTAASPALTLDRAYLSTEDGVHSLSLDLQQQLEDASAPAGTSSPAVAEDGTLYVVTTNGLLRAYATQPGR